MKNIVLLVPEDAWDTLHQSLVLDTQSAGVDRPLREELKAALAQVQTITEPVAALLDEAEMVPRTAHLLTGAGTAHVIGEERIGKLNRALCFFRSPFKLHGGRRLYKRQLV